MDGTSVLVTEYSSRTTRNNRPKTVLLSMVLRAWFKAKKIHITPEIAQGWGEILPRYPDNIIEDERQRIEPALAAGVACLDLSHEANAFFSECFHGAVSLNLADNISVRARLTGSGKFQRSRRANVCDILAIFYKCHAIAKV